MLHWSRQFIVAAAVLALTVGSGLGQLQPDFRAEAKSWLEQGIKQAEQENYNAALQALHKAIELNPRLQSAYYNIGFIHFKAGRPAQAIYNYYEALKLDPGDIQAQRGLGLAYAAQNNWQRAATVFAGLLKATPDDPEAARQLGQAYLQLQQPDQAIGPLQKAARLRPEDPLTHLYLAQALMLANRDAQAKQHLLKAQQLKPDSLQIKRELLNFYLASGQFLSAEPLSKQLVAAHPDDKQLLSAQVKIYQEIGLARERRQAQEALLKQLPQKEALAARAQIADEYLSEARYSQALGHLKILHQAQPQQSDITTTLAQCYLRLDQPEEALELLKESLSEHPGDAQLATMLGDLYVGRQQLDQALDAYKQALAAQRDYIPALRAACQVGAQLGLATQLTGWLRRLVATTPRDWSARMMLANQLALTGHPGPAIYQFSQIVNSSCDQELISGARHSLIELAQKTGNAAYRQYLYSQYAAQSNRAGLASECSAEQITKERITQLIEANPDSLEAKALLAEFQLQTGETDKAEKTLQQILHKQPQQAQANYLMGRLSQQREDYEAAQVHLRKSILTRPAVSAPYQALLECAKASDSLGEVGDFLASVLADVLNSKQETGQAIYLIVKYLAQARQATVEPKQIAAELAGLSDAFPHSPQLSLEVARLLGSLGQTEKAAQYYRRAARSPEHGSALAEAALLQLQDHPQAALTAANTYLGRIAGDEEALWLIIELQSSSQQPSSPQIQALAQLLSSQPHSAAYEIAKVNLLKLAGRLTEAESSLTAAVATDPDNTPLRIALAYVLWLQEKPTEALTHLEQLPAGALADPSLRILKATILAGTNSQHRAIDELGQALVAQPHHPQAALLRAELLGKAGKQQEALWELCQVLTFHPEIEVAGEAIVEMHKQASLPANTILAGLSQAYATTRQPETIRQLVVQLGELGAKEPVQQWLANHPAPPLEDK